MFLEARVIDWRIDGGRRVPNKTSGNSYILNTNRMFEITEDYNSNPQFYFFDNPADSRCGGARMKLDGILLSILSAADTNIGSVAVTLDYFPNEDPTETTEEITIGKANIAYCYPYRFDADATETWVVYIDAGWDVKRILVDSDMSTMFSSLEPSL